MLEEKTLDFETPLPYKYTPYPVHSSKYNDTLLNTENECTAGNTQLDVINNQKRLYDSMANTNFYNETLHEMAINFGFITQLGDMKENIGGNSFNFTQMVTDLATFYLMDYHSNPENSLKPE